MSFTSIGTQDGYVRESSELSGLANLVNVSSGAFLLGDDALRRQFRGMLSFNSAALPDNAVIISARLMMRKQGQVGSDPFGTHGSLVFDVQRPNFGASSSLSFDDFSALPGLKAAGSIGKLPVNGLYSGALVAAGLPFVNRTGGTQFRLRFQLDDDNDAVGDYLAFYSGNALTSSDRPTLTVVYYLP